ncbi:IclR family transcriptional regulator domain-containing protein [Rhodopseudomonas sp.]|uniref:IclR family transcriptional regulator domain-containing protein n=1 Tax=Rhodopseudomonas sp. TaxID=1078 RepID=UPI003B3A8FD2
MPKMKRPETDASDAPEIIESLARGLRVIEAFGAERPPLTRSDLAKACALPRATVRRVLTTLRSAGYATSDDRLFALTPRVLGLASAYLASNQISAVLQPLMDEVSAVAKEVCSLAILDGDDAVFVARASPARVFSAGIDLGYRLPLFCTSVGRVLLGRLDNAALTATVEAMNLVAQTPETVVDKPTVVATIIADRTRGYSLVDREAEPGFRSIAVPIRRYDGSIVAAANIGAHVDRITTGEMIDRFLPPLQRMADEARPLIV